MRIAYCIDSINNVGGIQRVTVAKANALAEIPGNEVWIMSADHSGERMFKVSPKVRVVDLGVDYYKDDWKSRWNVLKGIVIKRCLHRRRLEEALHEVNPDILVSVGQSEKNFLQEYKGSGLQSGKYIMSRTIDGRRPNLFLTRFLLLEETYSIILSRSRGTIGSWF